MQRRHFISVFRSLVWGGFAMLIFGLIDRQRNKESGDTVVRFTDDLAEGVHFRENVIAVVNREQVIFLSSACTHLGCSIQKTEGDRLICPCHGSVFDFQGKVIKGPAERALETLSYQKDPATGDFLVHINRG